MKKIACMVVCIALLVFLLVPVTSAQLLNNQWFDIKFKANGLFHNPGNVEVTPISYSAVAIFA